MENEIVEVKSERPLSAVDVRKQVNLIQEVMKNVMKEGEHYGTVPGCGDKKTLLLPGGDKLAMTFRLGPQYEELPGSVEGDNFICYKIDCVLVHTPTGIVVGHGRGTCNSKEKKYRTRSVYASKATDEEKAVGKLEKRNGRDGKPYDVYIVPQDPWDVQNTIYKMACKRAFIAAILKATAASDIFTQDVEDIPEGTVIEEESSPKPSTKPSVKEPRPKKQAAASDTKPSGDVDNAEILTIAAAEELNPPDVFNVSGKVVSVNVRNVNTKNGEREISDYIIADETGENKMKISVWGVSDDWTEEGELVVLRNVSITIYKQAKQYLAQSVAPCGGVQS